jgi:hypothetical protein
MSLITSSYLEIITDCEYLRHLPMIISLQRRLHSHMSSSPTSGSLRFRTTSQHEPMRKPPQDAKTAVWTAGRTGVADQTCMSEGLSQKPKGKEETAAKLQPSLPSST